LAFEQDADLCTHFDIVFNQRFAHFWDTEPGWSDAALRSEVERRYSFPTIPGVQPEFEDLLEMRYSRFPSSPEFDAISWTEGRLSPDGPQDGTGGAGGSSQPILLAHIDIDNDGKLDTVMKIGFSRGYNWLVSKEYAPAEYIWVWRDSEAANLTLDPRLIAQMPLTERPALVTPSDYQRPFIYHEKTYLARYQLFLRSPGAVESESMSIVELRDGGSTDGSTGRPVLDEATLCRFSMYHAGKSAKRIRK
jgi:hypothetical protein